VVEALLAAGADRDATENDGATALFVASQFGHLAAVEVLLAAGADKDTKKENGDQAWLAQMGDVSSDSGGSGQEDDADVVPL
jgi:ankyrin repeat protein